MYLKNATQEDILQKNPRFNEFWLKDDFPAYKAMKALEEGECDADCLRRKNCSTEIYRILCRYTSEKSLQMYFTFPAFVDSVNEGNELMQQ